MRRLLGAFALGLTLWTVAVPVSASGPVAAAAQVDGGVDPIAAMLPVIANPNVALLLLVVGLIGIVAELYHPGAFVPGITGVIALLLALVAFGSLPTNWGAVALLTFSVVLFVLELHLPSHGMLGGGGVLAFLLGGLLLFSRTPSAPSSETVEVNRWLLLATGGGLAGFVLLVVRVALRTRHLPATHQLLRLTGARGVAAVPLAPAGSVRVLHELWSAVAEGATVEAGEVVEVVGREGLTLRVRRVAPALSYELRMAMSRGEVRPGMWVDGEHVRWTREF
jgi:membrane-bound serine protease (ClpP class)